MVADFCTRFWRCCKGRLVFVKEKKKSIKVFEASQITETSDWNLKPFCKTKHFKRFRSSIFYGCNGWKFGSCRKRC